MDDQTADSVGSVPYPRSFIAEARLTDAQGQPDDRGGQPGPPLAAPASP